MVGDFWQNNLEKSMFENGIYDGTFGEKIALCTSVNIFVG